jgi:hypothetical protein
MTPSSQPELILSGGAIRVFGDIGQQLPSRPTWNDATGWKGKYVNIPIPGEVVAESFLGDQYLVVDLLVARWDPESGDTEPTGLSLDDWIARMREDASTEVPVWLLSEFERSNGSLAVTEHLAPRLPFILGGEFEVDNLYAADAVKDLEWRAQLAVQLRDLPDGAEVKLHVRWEA